MAYTNLRKGRFSQVGMVYHITAVTRQRTPYFYVFSDGRKVVQELLRLDSQGITTTLCYVVMPDHLHWLMVLQKSTLPEVVRLLKGRSARSIGHSIWQPNYHDHAVRAEEDLRQLARYIIANPLRANLVNNIGEYSLWDAIWLEETLSG